MSPVIIGNATLYLGDCLQVLAGLPAESVQCCVTSPPYFGLRDYGHAEQIGLEETPEQYIGKLVQVFREVRRVLRADGTLWLNLGDSYGTGKQIMGIPWRVALALQNDGWLLRQDIIWHKPNPMPEPVRDRCTKAHEYIFLLSKDTRYFYDADAIKEPETMKPQRRITPRKANPTAKVHGMPIYRQAEGGVGGGMRNRRSVWTVPTKPYAGAHFATFPTDIIQPCIMAGSRQGDTVLDPFNGSGTTGAVSLGFGRDYIGIELNKDFIDLSVNRIIPISLQQDVFYSAA